MSRLVGLLVIILNFSVAGYAQEEAKEGSPSSVEAATSPEKDVTYLICKNKSAVRTLRVQTRKNGSCFTTYTKNGVDQVVGSSSDGPRCAKVLANIRENLEKATWKCKDISEARVSSSE